MFAKAIANNDVAWVAFEYDEKIEGCLGFAIQRTDLKTKKEEPLPAWVGFAGDASAGHEQKTTVEWPVQKFTWRDFTAKHGGRYRYRIVPMAGKPGRLKGRDDLSQTTNSVQLTPDCGDISVYFNRGIIATQAMSRALPQGPSGKPNPNVLRERIDQPGDPLRLRLAGQSPQALRQLLDRAKAERGTCYAALYELNDTELVEALLATPNLQLILSNAGDDDETNLAARQTLHEADKQVVDRMLSNGHIGHNKFVVYVDSHGVPQAVLTGSTNWTSTGLCAQTNNAILVNSSKLAKAYLAYWKRLQADAAAQSAQFRQANTTPITDGALKVWFSPNTKQKTKPTVNPPTPTDMQEVFDIIHNAKQAVMFLAFIPGTPSIMDAVREASLGAPSLFVRGALTDRKAAQDFVELYHRKSGKHDARVVPASSLSDQFAYWEAELYSLGHAIIHDKIVVVDPFSENCTVVTGSHNLGFKASYANDENLVIIRGNHQVAQAYTAHVLDVYDHYRWRYRVQQAANDRRVNRAWTGLEKTDTWQDKYFEPNSPPQQDFAFWRGL